MVKTKEVHYSRAGENYIYCTGKAPENWSTIRITDDFTDVTCPACKAAKAEAQVRAARTHTAADFNRELRSILGI